MDLSLEPPCTLAVIDDMLAELRVLARLFRDRDYSNDDCAAELEEWIDKAKVPGVLCPYCGSRTKTGDCRCYD